MVKNGKKNEDTAPTETVNSGVNSEKSGRGGFFSLGIFLLLLLAGCSVVMALRWLQSERDNNAVVQRVNTENAQKIAALQSRIEALERKTSEQNISLNAENGISAAEIENRLNALRQEMNAKFAANASKEVPMPISYNDETIRTAEVLLANGAMIVRDLAEKGEDFAYEAEVLQILAQGNEPAMKYVSAMQRYANSGVIGKDVLIKRFNLIFAELNQAEVYSEPEEEKVSDENLAWYEGIWEWLKGVFVSRKGSQHPVFKAEEDEVLQLVNEGNLREALNAMKLNGKYAKMNYKPLNEWSRQTADYLDFNKAASGLIMNALANLHMKEMEKQNNAR